MDRLDNGVLDPTFYGLEFRHFLPEDPVPAAQPEQEFYELQILNAELMRENELLKTQLDALRY